MFERPDSLAVVMALGPGDAVHQAGRSSRAAVHVGDGAAVADALRIADALILRGHGG